MRLVLSFLIVAVTAGSLSAQKVGHVHSIQLLSMLPEIAVADSLLAVYQKELQGKGDSLVQTFQAHYQAYVQETQAGTLSQPQAQSREAALQEEQQQLQSFEQAGQQLIMQRRQTLYEPILNKVDGIIKAIGKDEGYVMIFDSSVQAMVYVRDSEDILPKVLARLGRG